MASISLRVNGQTRTVNVEPATPLLYVLRNDLELQGPRFGCGLGQCGACTVLVKGAAVRSCVTAVSSVQGTEITTLEGLASNGKLHPLQQAWIDEQVPACGYCQNGQILTAKALLDRTPSPTDAQIRQGMANTLCRCMTYYRIQAAIKRAAATMRADAGGPGRDPQRGAGEVDLNAQRGPGDVGRDMQRGSGDVGRDPQRGSGDPGRDLQRGSGDVGRDPQRGSGDVGRDPQRGPGEEVTA